MIMNGFIIHPCSSIADIRGVVFVLFGLMAWSVNLSIVNVNSIICTSKLGVCKNMLVFSCVAPCIYILCLGIVLLGMCILLFGMCVVGAMLVNVLLRYFSLVLAFGECIVSYVCV